MWIVLGFGFLAAETLTPGGFFVFFFGLAAVAVGCLELAGVAGSDSMQWLLFSVLSVVSLLLLRPRLVGRFRAAGNTPMPEYVGDVAVLTSDLAPGGVGKAELRGTSWNVRSRSSAFLPTGARCTVERVEGLTLWIVPPGGIGASA
jgi:hypothetical protein